MVDTRDSKSRDSNIMRVRVSPAAHFQPSDSVAEGKVIYTVYFRARIPISITREVP